jgi:16S rRNA (cytidine1402-2'-O)-methyltransferase
MNQETGILYLCPTPIGNLEDITFRVLKTLKNVDVIAAEDTRVTRKLLNYYEIKTPTTSYFEHNKQEKGPELISLMQNGKNIALVTDAGTPGISDPGEDLVKKAIEAQIKVVPLPGPVAAVCALVGSGLSTERFVFEGFLPRKNKDRKQILTELIDETRTIILYESPYRLIQTLQDLMEYLGNRFIVVARELTKVHEEFIRGTIADVINRFNEVKPRGEIIILIEGNKSETKEQRCKNCTISDEMDITDLTKELQSKLELYLGKGLSRNKALKKAAEEFGISKNEAYDILLNQDN